MDGLTKIISKIQSDTDLRCEAILNKANQDAQIILQDAKSDAEKQHSLILQEAENEANIIAEKAVSSCELTKKRALLEAKGCIINNVIKDALDHLCSLDTDEYFDNIKLLVKATALTGIGKIYFNKTDYDRIPANFLEAVNELLDEEKRIASVSNECINCKGGFVMSYEEMRVDCTFESLLDDASEAIKDKLNEVLFS